MSNKILKKKLKNIFSKSIIFFIATLIPLKIGDYYLGVSINKKSEIKRSLILKENTKATNKIVEPTARDLEYSDNLIPQKFKLRTDLNGFVLGDGENAEDIKLNPHIIFFGGSTTECLYNQEENRFPHLVGENLSIILNKNIKVLNGGVSGNNSMHSFLNLIAKGINQSPKSVILMHAINDLSILSKTNTYWNAPKSIALIENRYSEKQSQKNIILSYLRDIKNFVAPNTWKIFRNNFMPYISRSLAIKKSDKFIKNDQWKGFRNKFNFNNTKAALDKEFRGSIRAFVLTARSFGIEPILMTQFNRINKNDLIFIKEMKEAGIDEISEFIDLYEYTNQIIREVSKEESITLIDLDSYFKGKEKYLYDSVHLNDDGSREAAKFITSKILLSNSLNFIEK